MLANNPAPMVPAPRAIVLPRKERRLMYRFRGLTLFSKLSSRGRFSLLLKSFAVGFLIVFIPLRIGTICTARNPEKVTPLLLWRTAQRHVTKSSPPVSFQLSSQNFMVTRELCSRRSALYESAVDRRFSFAIVR